MQHVDLGATVASECETPRNGACAPCEIRVNWGQRVASNLIASRVAPRPATHGCGVPRLSLCTRVASTFPNAASCLRLV